MIRNVLAVGSQLALLTLIACGSDSSSKSNGESNGGTTGSEQTGGGADASVDEGGGTGGDNGSNGSMMGNTAGGSSVTLEDYCAASYAGRAAWEPWISKCCEAGAAEATGFPLSGYGQDYIDSCTRGIGESVDAGSVVFHGEHAMACAQFENRLYPAPYATCQNLEDSVTDPYYWGPKATSEDCLATFEGTVAMGQKCSRSMDCKRGMSCQKSGAQFVCQPLAKEFGSCGSTEDCEDGLRCVGEFNKSTCRKTPSKVGEPCTVNQDCSSGLRCKVPGFTCFTPSKVGQICSTSSDCDGDLICGFSSNKCEAVTKLADGAKCQYQSDCKSDWCKDGVCTSYCSP